MQFFSWQRFLVGIFVLFFLGYVLIFGYGQYHAYRINHDEFIQGEVIWHSCLQDKFAKWFDEDEVIDTHLQCTTIQTPLEPFDHHYQQTITLALTRLPAKNHQAQDLLYIQGGPGFHGLSTPMYLAENNPDLHENFHLIGYAPRGIYPSTPQISCDYKINKTGKEIAEGCFKNTPPELLARISTRYAVEDIEFIRKKLHIQQLNAFGVSYGTKVLNYYTQKYGNHLRAAVFDGLVDTTLAPFDDMVTMSQGFQNSFERFVQACLNDEFSDDCLFNDHEDINEQFHQIIREIAEKQLTDGTDELIDGDTLLFVFMDSLYAKEIWDYAHTALISLRNHHDVKFYTLLKEYSKHSENEDSGLVAINCADYATKSRHNKKVYLAQMKKVDEAARFDNYRTHTEEDALDACYYWKTDGSDDFALPVAVKGTPPLLFFSFAHDPATPHHQAVKMAHAFGSPLITREGDGHGAVFSGSACIDEVALAYLINPQQPILAKNCPAVIGQ